MKKTVSALSAALFLLALTAPIAAAAEVDLAAAKATFEATCSKCHGISRPMGVKGRDRDGWTATVKKMAGYHADSFGQPITAADQAAIVEYLVKNAGK